MISPLPISARSHEGSNARNASSSSAANSTAKTVYPARRAVIPTPNAFTNGAKKRFPPTGINMP